MTLERYAQEFTDPETGEVDGVTFEALEFWTEAGWEIIPAGFRFSLRAIPAIIRKLLRPEEIPLLILHEWHIAAKNSPRRDAVRLLRRDLIKCLRKRQSAGKGRFLRFFAGMAKVEVICIMVRLFGMIRRWYICNK